MRRVALLLLELGERVEVAQEFVGGVSELVLGLDVGLPLVPDCRATLAPLPAAVTVGQDS
jgi:hypothetical protein